MLLLRTSCQLVRIVGGHQGVSTDSRTVKILATHCGIMVVLLLLLHLILKNLLNWNGLHVVIHSSILIKLALILLGKNLLDLLLFLLSTLILFLILRPLLGRNELFSDLSASYGRSRGSVKLIHSRHAHLGLVHHGRIGIIFSSLLQFLHFGVVFVKISH